MILYRYQKKCFDEDLKSLGKSNVIVTLESYDVIRETKCYYIIKLPNRREKRVNKDQKHSWACLSTEDALKRFKHRCYHSMGRSEYNIEYCNLALKFAKENL
jgi:hypothetical protein